MLDLTSYRTLGRSGLVVSPMALGTMTFGADRWGVDESEAGAILGSYVDAGGNFIDTADIYAGGRSEEMIGRAVASSSLRDKLVIGTKFTWNLDPGNPNAGGNGRKNIMRALQSSLRRLQTDYIDLYWLHFWDMVTPVEDVLQSLTDLVRAGHIRYFALSDVPAWYLARMAALAGQGPGPIALQTEYSLVERTAENEHVAAARASGMDIMPWSPLAGGFLAGKYRQGATAAATPTGEGRLAGSNPFGSSKFTERNWAILEALRQVADRIGRSPAEVALRWTIGRPGVGSLLIGASRVEQIAPNIEALGLSLSAEDLALLDSASAPAPAFPYTGFSTAIRKTIFGGSDVQGWA
jgi:aryl-alcohol dehydrogenase-like predicted oxidoreductase